MIIKVEIISKLNTTSKLLQISNNNSVQFDPVQFCPVIIYVVYTCRLNNVIANYKTGKT